MTHDTPVFASIHYAGAEIGFVTHRADYESRLMTQRSSNLYSTLGKRTLAEGEGRAQALEEGVLGPRGLAESGLLGLLLRCLAAQDDALRGLAYEGLALYEARLRDQTFRWGPPPFAPSCRPARLPSSPPSLLPWPPRSLFLPLPYLLLISRMYFQRMYLFKSTALVATPLLLLLF